MDDLRVGDKVRVRDSAWGHQGATGTVNHIYSGCANVDLDYNFKQDEYFRVSNLERVDGR